MKIGNLIFIDTNILVYSVDKDSPYHQETRDLIDKIDNRQVLACLSPQILGEFYSTITNPKKIKKPLTPDEAVEIVEGFLEADTVEKIYPTETTFTITLDLVRRYQIKALDFFDAYIVATMLDNRVRKLCTANDKDFKVFNEIEVINPLK
ncbi:PIN domain-containing protein [bacterium]|nr:PIN domain-containing protein [bacterium]MBU1599099.1 PIN domain-containing protein [bacterium]MBU2461339.1 PIN domain-containing protein [bacterium]